MKRIVQSQPRGKWLGFVESATIAAPTKDEKRYSATVGTTTALGDTIEEACDNLTGMLGG